MVDQVRREEVDPTTLARAKAKVLADEFLYKQSNSERAADAALNELYGLGLDAPRHLRQAVEKLDAPMLRQTAQAYLKDPSHGYSYALGNTHRDGSGLDDVAVTPRAVFGRHGLEHCPIRCTISATSRDPYGLGFRTFQNLVRLGAQDHGLEFAPASPQHQPAGGRRVCGSGGRPDAPERRGNHTHANPSAGWP